MKFKLTAANLINAVGVIVIVSLVFELGGTIKRNYDLNKQIEDMKQQTAILKEQRDALAYNIEYYKTDSFHEREARAKLGLQLPGEQVVALPSPSATPLPGPDAGKSTKKKSNFQQWMDFLTGRS
jgi:cell division protein FtsB